MMSEGQGAVYMHIPPPGMEIGQPAKKLGRKEKYMDSR